MTRIMLKGHLRLILSFVLLSLAVSSAVFLIVVFIVVIPQPRDTGCAGRYEKPPCGPGAEIGRPYSYTIYTHCGIRSAFFDGRRWIADPILSVDNVNPPPGWGNPFDKGSMELVAEDLAKFTSSAGLVADFLARFTSSAGLVAEFRPLPEGAEYPWRPCL